MIRDINITFIWVPDYTNIEWNEIANKAAKEAEQSNNHIQLLDILKYSDIKPISKT